MPRSREELVEAAREEAQRRTLGRDVTSLLTELADLLDSLEERDNWRVVADPSNGAPGTVVGGPYAILATAQRWREEFNLTDGFVVYRNLRIQHCTGFRTPWTDVEEGDRGC